jgi:hypothetical protein
MIALMLHNYHSEQSGWFLPVESLYSSRHSPLCDLCVLCALCVNSFLFSPLATRHSPLGFL